MPPTSDKVTWRRSPDAPITVSAAAFARVVAENGLTPITVDGYLWAWLPTEDGYDTYRTYGPKWAYLYQAKRVNTQDNVGGGALHTTIAVPAGMTAQLVSMYAQGTASAGAALDVYIYDEDGGLGLKIASIAAGVSRSAHLPSQGTGATSTSNTADSRGLLLGPGEYFDVYSSAALQTETLTVSVALLLPITATADSVVWGTTGSAGTPNLAASTISAANTIQPVLMP